MVTEEKRFCLTKYLMDRSGNLMILAPLLWLNVCPWMQLFYNFWDRLLKMLHMFFCHHMKWKRLSVDEPSHDVPSLSIFLPKSRQRMSRRHVTSWSYTTWCHMIWQSEPAQVNLSENPKITFFNLATLTFDLWPWPLNLSEILSRSTPPPNFESIRSTI